MRRYIRCVAFALSVIVLLACLGSTSAVRASEIALPEGAKTQAGVPLIKVGNGTFRKLGFRIYEATLWAAQSKWEEAKPFALQLHYARSLSKDTLIDTVMDDIEEQGVADTETRARWRKALDASLSDIKDSDVLIGLALPDKKKTVLLYNDAVIATIDEKAFSDAFFAVWLGSNADEDLRAELLGGG